MLKIPSQFLARLREPIDWTDLRYGYAHQLVDGQAVIDHACRVLCEAECDNDEILAIAIAKRTDRLEPLIVLVTGPIEPPPDLSRKWALILSAFINESDVPDKLNAIEEVYSSFDYPEELSGMVRYMPMQGPDLGSREANESRMLDSLKELSVKIVRPG
jgi:hypothetical protein